MIVVGLDPAFANFGMVAGELTNHRSNWEFNPHMMQLITTTGGGKQRVVRKSSESLERGRVLHQALHEFLGKQKPDLVFVEVPSGAQNANAAAGLGIAIGVLASIRQPIIEVAPIEVKRLFTSKRQTVSKAQVIHWAFKEWPKAPWLTHGGKRTLNNEHLADACATIAAGVLTPTFKQIVAMQNSIVTQGGESVESAIQTRRRVKVLEFETKLKS